jgi:RNA polymerase subunit RPABC4/transcription elongation factor Spt4
MKPQNPRFAWVCSADKTTHIWAAQGVLLVIKKESARRFAGHITVGQDSLLNYAIEKTLAAAKDLLERAATSLLESTTPMSCDIGEWEELPNEVEPFEYIQISRSEGEPWCGVSVDTEERCGLVVIYSTDDQPIDEIDIPDQKTLDEVKRIAVHVAEAALMT